jgi:hypothetical protein
LRLGVSSDAVRAEFKNALRHTRATTAEMEESEISESSAVQPSRDEFALLQLLFQNEDSIQWVAGHLDLNWIRHPAVRDMVGKRIAGFKEETWLGLAPFLDLLPDAESRNLLTEAVTQNYREGIAGPASRGSRDHLRGRLVPKPFEDLRGIVTQLRNQQLQVDIDRLNREMAALEPCTPEQIETFRKKAALEALRRQEID